MATSIPHDRPADGVAAAGLFGLLLRPHRGWRAIERAHAGVGAPLVGWALLLAAIGPVAHSVHDLVWGHRSMGIIEYRPTPAGAVVTALAGWLGWLVALAVLAAAIGALSPRFGGRRDGAAAAKTAVFGSAAFLLAGVFAAVPALGFLQLLGLYSLLLLAVGAPRMMHVPDERSGGFGAAVAGIAVLLLAVALLVGAWVTEHWVEPTVETAHGRVVVSDGATIADTRLSAPASRKKGAVAPGTTAGTAPASSLQALLPERIGEFARTAVQSQSSVAGGVASADAKGTYVAGTNSFTLSITDAGQPGALATSNSVIAGEVNRVTDYGYQRSQVVNGVRVTEKWSNADHGGSHGRSVAGRFTVEAAGTAPSVDTLRRAVASVDARRLAMLGR